MSIQTVIFLVLLVIVVLQNGRRILEAIAAGVEYLGRRRKRK